MSSAFTPRFVAPTVGSIYWLSNDYGGYNLFPIRDTRTGWCLPNSTAYAFGRLYEINGAQPTTSLHNANTWYPNTSDGYPRGQIPKLGAVACWSGGSSGAGHVSIVEQINDDGTIITGNSDYSGREFYLLNMSGVNPYLGSSFTFQGYIYASGDPELRKIPLWLYYIRNKLRRKQHVLLGKQRRALPV